jgi:hypothetical protein
VHLAQRREQNQAASHVSRLDTQAGLAAALWRDNALERYSDMRNAGVSGDPRYTSGLLMRAISREMARPAVTRPAVVVTLRGVRARPTHAPLRAGRMRVRTQASANATDVVIVGAGVAGLCCAKRLHEVRQPPPALRVTRHARKPAWLTLCASGLLQAGVSFVLLEAAEEVGGRVRTRRTDEVSPRTGCPTLHRALRES